MSRRDDIDSDEMRPQRARKNTRRWCKGKVGVEHQLAIRLNPKIPRIKTCQWFYRRERRWSRFVCIEQEYCTVCGKILRYSLGKSGCHFYTPESEPTAPPVGGDRE